MRSILSFLFCLLAPITAFGAAGAAVSYSPSSGNILLPVSPSITSNLYVFATNYVGYLVSTNGVQVGSPSDQGYLELPDVSSGFKLSFGATNAMTANMHIRWPRSPASGLIEANYPGSGTNVNLTFAAGVSGDLVTSGTVADARIASTIARDSEVAAAYQPVDADLTALASAGSVGSGAFVRESAAGGSLSYDITITNLTTDAAVKNIYTNEVGKDLTRYFKVFLIGAGPTNYFAGELAAVVANQDETGLGATNQTVTLATAGLTGYWERDGTNAVLRVKGHADENVAWRAVGSFYTATNGAPAAAGPTYLVEENAEGTGSPGGWVNAASPNWDYTATVLQGSQSWSGSAGANSYIAFTGQTTVEAYCLLRIAGYPSATGSYLSIRDSGGGALAIFRIGTAGAVTIFASGSDSSAATDTFAVDTTYHVKIRYVSGGTCTAEFSITGTFSGSGNKFVSKTGGTGTAERLVINAPSATGSAVTIADRLLADDDVIGNNP